jgi:hypothetical protein
MASKEPYNDHTTRIHQNMVSKHQQTNTTLEEQNGALCPILRHRRLLGKILKRSLVLMLQKSPLPQTHQTISRV